MVRGVGGEVLPVTLLTVLLLLLTLHSGQMVRGVGGKVLYYYFTYFTVITSLAR